MRNALIISLALIPTMASADDIPPELAAIASKMQQIQTLQVTMHQKKEMKIFGEVLESTGTLVFARPRRLAMDLTGPGGNTLIVDGDQMIMHYKALKKTERMSLSGDPRAKAVAEHLFLLLDAEPRALLGVYDITIENKKPLIIRLVPKAEALRRLIAHVDTRFDARGFVDELVMHEPGGDTTRWLFADPVLNEKIPEARFKVGG